MKVGEILKETQIKLGDYCTQALGFPMVHAMFLSMKDAVEEIDDVDISNKYDEIITLIENKRMDIQEKEVK